MASPDGLLKTAYSILSPRPCASASLFFLFFQLPEFTILPVDIFSLNVATAKPLNVGYSP
jgi:hypothetical protein